MTDNSHKSPPAVIVISSHVARGSVGNRAAVFALEVMGFSVWAVPTVILPWHPGHGSGTRIVPGEKQFAALLDDLQNAPWIGEVGAVLSGYLGNPQQAKAVANLVKAIKRANPDVVYLCDPVIGDAQGLYVGKDLVAAIADDLVSQADIITPNRFELARLCGFDDLPDNKAILDAARDIGREVTLVTSAHASTETGSGNLLWVKDQDLALLAEHSLIENPPNGPGDLTAAIFLARWLQGCSAPESLHQTTASVFEILNYSAAENADELPLESQISSLLHPLENIDISQM